MKPHPDSKPFNEMNTIYCYWQEIISELEGINNGCKIYPIRLGKDERWDW